MGTPIQAQSAIGPPVDATAINNALVAAATKLREACQAALGNEEYIVSLGTSGLENAGFSPADAATIQQLSGYLNTVAGIYFGTVAQPAAFDFDNALLPLTAGGIS